MIIGAKKKKIKISLCFVCKHGLKELGENILI